MKKRFLCFGLLFFMVVSLVACTGELQADNSQNEDNIQTQEPPKDDSLQDNFEEDLKTDRPQYSLEADFEENEVIVTLTFKASFERIFDDYTAEDFSEVGAISVSELTCFTTPAVRQCLLADPTGGTIPDHLQDIRRMFLITLAEESKENVLQAIDVLYEREDILVAGPNFIYHLD